MVAVRSDVALQHHEQRVEAVRAREQRVDAELPQGPELGRGESLVHDHQPGQVHTVFEPLEHLRVGADASPDIDQDHVRVLQLAQHGQVVKVGDAAHHGIFRSRLKASGQRVSEQTSRRAQRYTDHGHLPLLRLALLPVTHTLWYCDHMLQQALGGLNWSRPTIAITSP
jgi:hypothetical protein